MNTFEITIKSLNYDESYEIKIQAPNLEAAFDIATDRFTDFVCLNGEQVGVRFNENNILEGNIDATKGD